MRVWEQLVGRSSAPESVRGFSLNELIGLFNDPETGLLQTTWGNLSEEEVISSVEETYRQSGPVAALIFARLQIFSQARFQWTRGTGGNPRDMFGTQELQVLEFPWPGGTTADLLARMEVDVSTAGNSFTRRLKRGSKRQGTAEDRLVRLRPQWVRILLGSQEDADHPSQAADVEKLGYAYLPNGEADRMILLDPDQVAHYAPLPDPVNHFRGMSWVTPVLGSVRSDAASETHKFKYFENASTPNLAIKFDPTATVEDIKAFKELLDEEHKGRFNAYKTLFLGGGADPVVVGANLQQMAFAETQGKGESRLAAAAGVPPSWVGFSEGLQGSALNAGNFTAARRRMADGTMHHLWAAASSALEVLLERPPSQAGEAPARLWHDTRWVPFLREDAKDHAETQAQEAATMRTLIEAGYVPDSVVAAIRDSDWTLLKHSGLVSVQLQKPGSGNPTNPQNGGPDA